MRALVPVHVDKVDLAAVASIEEGLEIAQADAIDAVVAVGHSRRTELEPVTVFSDEGKV
jgi:hypothetical protein